MSWDRDKIIDLLLRAGDVARRARKSLEREFKADSSLVTAADREVEDLLSRALEDPGAGIYIIGEETVEQKGEAYLEAAMAAETYVIDPIDGTSPYAHWMPNWGVSIGRMEGGALRDGAVFLPDFGEIVLSDGDEVLEGSRGEAGEWRWSPLEPAGRDTDGARLVAITQGLAKRGSVNVRNPVQVLGSAVVPLVGLLQGRFSGYLGSVKLWDVAGALPLLLRHGFSISVRENGEIRRVGAEVTDRIYHLAPGEGRWKFRSNLLIARSEDEERFRAAFSEDW